jgi:GNAT superfamily N-acetyltransferase
MEGAMQAVKLSYTIVNQNESINLVAGLAASIWHEYYTPIIGSAQVTYMVEKFQSPDAIAQQIHEGYHYGLLWLDHDAIGYFAAQVKQEQLFVSKIYLTSAHRGRGLGAQALRMINEVAKQRNCTSLGLTVNKHNHIAIQFYLRMGFVIKEALIMDIGEGYVMDDYRMEKTLK